MNTTGTSLDSTFSALLAELLLEQIAGSSSGRLPTDETTLPNSYEQRESNLQPDLQSTRSQSAVFGRNENPRLPFVGGIYNQDVFRTIREYTSVIGNYNRNIESLIQLLHGTPFLPTPENHDISPLPTPSTPLSTDQETQEFTDSDRRNDYDIFRRDEHSYETPRPDPLQRETPRQPSTRPQSTRVDQARRQPPTASPLIPDTVPGLERSMEFPRIPTNTVLPLRMRNTTPSSRPSFFTPPTTNVDDQRTAESVAQPGRNQSASFRRNEASYENTPLPNYFSATTSPILYNYNANNMWNYNVNNMSNLTRLWGRPSTRLSSQGLTRDYIYLLNLPAMRDTTTSTGMTPEEITEETFETVYDSSNNHMSTQCPISFDEFQPGETILQIRRCGHTFKPDELRRWLVRHTGCPVCRCDLRTTANSADEPRYNQEPQDEEQQDEEQHDEEPQDNEEPQDEDYADLPDLISMD